MATAEQKRRDDYRITFESTEGIRVLGDLARFCWANKPTYAPGDALTSAFREGQRSVWLRLQRMLNLTDEDMFAAMYESKRHEEGGNSDGIRQHLVG